MTPGEAVKRREGNSIDNVFHSDRLESDPNDATVQTNDKNDLEADSGERLELIVNFDEDKGTLFLIPKR
jgi:hypothetical protein